MKEYYYEWKGVHDSGEQYIDHDRIEAISIYDALEIAHSRVTEEIITIKLLNPFKG